MAKRSYVPRHAVAPVASTPVARKAVTVLATSIGVAAAATALANPADASGSHHGHMGVWDRVASCESGMRWHVDTGNGFYGGLQFSSGTWHAYHGTKYAHQASDATRMEQIQVARRVLKSQGRNAWPVCGPRAGLTRSNGKATGASLPGSAENGSGHKEQKMHNGTRKSSHGTSHKKSHHKTTHRSTHGTHKTRTHHDGVYVVRRGDTLSSIAHAEHVPGGWHALYRANRARLHNDPNVLHVGQRLLLP